MPQVDPRGRGGAEQERAELVQKRGRSPRARGSRIDPCSNLPLLRSIPAGAGEPFLLPHGAKVYRVDPRGRGGAPGPSPLAEAVLGRSPRARGSPATGQSGALRPGSIPAGAGEPLDVGPGLGVGGVDPRGRGGALTELSHLGGGQGRSPRARGSRHDQAQPPLHQRSIPAGAGEPRCASISSSPARVDPRGRGGANMGFRVMLLSLGRSPRARGSRSCSPPGSGRRRSIPAGAGEPQSLHVWSCGQGSIPAGAGEPWPRPGASARVWSIPAGAGEPRYRLVPFRQYEVDPRGRGGAVHHNTDQRMRMGRSPRARGSQGGRGLFHLFHRSIPAGAGEPFHHDRYRHLCKVDPRGRGGARHTTVEQVISNGRSPRARGSHYPMDDASGNIGSIPAGAGEPHGLKRLKI
ncbi:hypothetical protein MIT9_P2180 [Methylomarinovum caldicuralii]|uniref:Uncharacterized protein n=1 Tax=Methylomarinovum caldicuralii TaxID=438856 RepID=A0AAU9CDA4_9GAMM|nr:hypothetical protein MIT9_P2180 [Methylomarinovum caldicuralii]